MSKKYYWKMNGYLYEVSKEQYYEYRREQNRHDYLKKQKQEAVILSLDALGAVSYTHLDVYKRQI